MLPSSAALVYNGIMIEIQELDMRHRGAVNSHIDREWGNPIVTMGNIIDTRDLPGFVNVEDAAVQGAALYRIADGECEIVALYSLSQARGVGSALIEAVTNAAKEAGCRRVFLITMNDNTHAIRFYQKRGFSLKAVHIDAFKATQGIKGMGEGVILGMDDIPILHEFEFEIPLSYQQG